MQSLKITNSFENYKHKYIPMIEPIKKPPIERKGFKEVLNECRKNQRGVGNPICK